MTTWKDLIPNPAPGHSLHHFRTINISSLKFRQLVMDGDCHFPNFQIDASSNLPLNKPSLLYLNVYLPRSDFWFGNIISVAVCFILSEQTNTNGNDSRSKLSGFYAASLAISAHAVIIVGDRLLVGLWVTALHTWTMGHITTRIPNGNLIREESILYRFYEPVEECEYIYFHRYLNITN